MVIDVQRQPGANVIETVERVKAELPRLQRAMPVGVTLTIVNDRTDTIRASIHDVQFTLVLSVGLVVLVVLMFLRTVRATIIAGVALPLSLIATFGVMWFCGFSLDNLSLMALTIGTGFVVDDAIVMIENIVRHIENGEAPLEAALRGAREIGFTVISLTHVADRRFHPAAVHDRPGRPHVPRVRADADHRGRGLGDRLADADADDVQPPPAPSGGEGRQPRRPLLQPARSIGTVEYYGRSLEWVLRHQALTLLVTLATLAATVWLYIVMPKGFLPSQDTGLISAVIGGRAPKSRSPRCSGCRRRSRPRSRRTRTSTASFRSSASAGSIRRRTPAASRSRCGRAMNAARASTTSSPACKRAVAPIPGMTVYFQPVQDIQISTRASRAQYQYTLVGTDAGEVLEWSDKLADADAAGPAAAATSPRRRRRAACACRSQVDRETAGRLGVSMQAINDTLNDAFGQRQISTIYSQANQYRVILEAQPRYQQDPASLSKLYVTGANTSTGTAAVVANTAAGTTNTNTSATPNAITGSNQVPLSTFARFEHTSAPLALAHQEQFPSVTISFNLPRGSALSDAVAAISRGAAHDRHAVVGDRRRIPATPPSSTSRWPASRGSFSPPRSRSTSCSACCTKA